MRKFYLFIVFVLISFCGYSNTNITSSEIKSQLNDLKKRDNLSDWIYLRIEYAGENPSRHLNFLMATQNKIWRKYKSANEKEAWLYLLINQAYYQLFTGDIVKSIELYEDANEFLWQHKLNIDADEYILKPLANNYTRIGDYEKAIFIQRKSLELALKNKNDSVSASIYNNLAISYLFKKEFENARSSVLKGLSLVKPKNKIYGLLFSVLADINYQDDILAEASKNVNTAIVLLQKNNESAYWLLSAYTLAGNIKLKQNSLTEATNYYNRGIDILTKNFINARKRELAHLLTQKGKIATKKRDYNSAHTLFNEALTNLIPSFNKNSTDVLPSEKDLYGENKLQEVLLAKAETFKLSGQDELALKSNLLAFYTSEKIRQEYTYNASKKQLQADAKQQAEQIINSAYQLWLKNKKEEYASIILLITEKTKARILLDEILDNQQKLVSNNKTYLEKIKIERAIAYYERQLREKQDKHLPEKIEQLRFQLSSIDKKLKIKVPEQQLNATNLLNKIPSHTKAVSFFFGDEYIFVIDAEKAKINNIKRIENAKVIEKQTFSFLNRYFYNGPSAMMNYPSKFHEESYQLYAKLLSGIEFKPAENFLLIRDGVLNLLAFEGLITESKYQSKIEKWPYLIKKANISYGFSLQTISSEKEKSNNGNDIFNGFFISNTGDNDIIIPAAEIEHDYLKDLLNGAFFLNKAATVDAFKKSFTHTDVLHISSHAFISKKESEPILELYKKKFYLFELGAQFNVPKFVVLSACQTADGELITGEGVMSMSRGFIASGTKGVISGLWKVNDNAGAMLMKSFYQNLLELNDVEFSLRKAKLDWLNNKNQNKLMLLPYYWDSLIYAGNNQEIYLSKNWINYNYLIFGAVIILIIIIIILVLLKRKTKL